jgi:hypothetical protein
MSRRSLSILLLVSSLDWALPIIAQTPAPTSNDDVRVRVTLNADGSRTTYQFDNAKHEAVATTTDEEGRPRGKVVYQIDDAGRFLSGVIFGPDDKFVFKTLYKYDTAGRLEEETHLTKDETVINKVVYKYDLMGKQTGYSIFDANGKLVSGTVSPTPSPTPAKHRNALGR